MNDRNDSDCEVTYSKAPRIGEIWRIKGGTTRWRVMSTRVHCGTRRVRLSEVDGHGEKYVDQATMRRSYERLEVGRERGLSDGASRSVVKGGPRG